MRTKKRKLRFIMGFILFQELGLLAIYLMTLRVDYLNMMGV